MANEKPCSIIHKILDIRGKMCPYTLIETRDTLKEMGKGEILQVITDYKPAALETIPNFCHKKGYPIEIIDSADGIYRLLIKKEEGDNNKIKDK